MRSIPSSDTVWIAQVTVRSHLGGDRAEPLLFEELRFRVRLQAQSKFSGSQGKIWPLQPRGLQILGSAHVLQCRAVAVFAVGDNAELSVGFQHHCLDLGQVSVTP